MTLATGLLARAALGVPLGATAIAAAIYAGFVGFAGRWLPDHAPHAALGAANRVTLLRAVIVAHFGAFCAYPEALAPFGWVLTACAVLALVLDGLDGWAARRFGTASRFGARFDQELDAAFVLVLAVLAWRLGKAGPWILLAGAWRYLFVALARLQPVLAAELFPSRRRRVICVVQSATLGGCLAPVFRTPVSDALCALALALLSLSFLVDLAWLWKSGARSVGGTYRTRVERSAHLPEN